MKDLLESYADKRLIIESTRKIINGEALYAIHGWKDYIKSSMILMDIDIIKNCMRLAKDYGTNKLTKAMVNKVHDAEQRILYFTQGYSDKLNIL